MTDTVNETSLTVAAGQLRAFIERIERLEEEKKDIADDIKDVYAEMKGQGLRHCSHSHDHPSPQKRSS